VLPFFTYRSFGIACALSTAIACVEAGSVKKKDRRTQVGSENSEGIQPDSGENDATPPVSDQPESDPKDPIPVGPTPYLLQDGNWRISRVTCGDGSTETLDSIWTYTQKDQLATFTKKSTGGCQQHQDAVVLLSDKKAVFTPGKNKCEGVCNAECKPILVAGTDLISSVEPASSGASLKSGLPLIPDFCTGKQPASIFMHPRVAEDCTEKWKTAFGSGSIQVLEGELRWNIPAIRKLEAHNITSIGTLSGDFTVEVQYKGLEAIGRGAYFKVAILDSADPKFQAFVLAGNNSSLRSEAEIHLAAVVVDGNFMDPPNSSTETRSQSSGTIRIEKRGTTVTASSKSTGDKSAEKSNPEGKAFSDGTYQLILSLGSNSNLVDINDVTSINIDRISVIDGSGKSLPIQDEFSCLSVVQN
jgi:hypothetical protein